MAKKLRTKPQTKRPSGIAFRRREPPLSQSAQRRLKRRQDQTEAETDFPNVKGKLKKIKSNLKENLSRGRFAYQESLKEMLSLIYTWENKEMLDDRLDLVARLHGVFRRSDANKFSVLVAACGGRDRKTVSRWSKQLDDAFSDDVRPKNLVQFLKDRRSSKESNP